MINPKGQIGKVILDENGVGIYRILTVRFTDGNTETLILNNVGENSKKAKEWSWEFKKNDGKTEWVKWGY